MLGVMDSYQVSGPRPTHALCPLSTIQCKGRRLLLQYQTVKIRGTLPSMPLLYSRLMFHLVDVSGTFTTARRSWLMLPSHSDYIVSIRTDSG